MSELTLEALDRIWSAPKAKAPTLAQLGEFIRNEFGYRVVVKKIERVNLRRVRTGTVLKVYDGDRLIFEHDSIEHAYRQNRWVIEWLLRHSQTNHERKQS